MDRMSAAVAAAYLAEAEGLSRDREVLQRDLLDVLIAGKGEGERIRRLARSLHLQLAESYVVVVLRSEEDSADVAMILDECLALPATEQATRASMERTLRWARRGRDRFRALASPTNPGQAQFGIVQGGVVAGLRRESARATVDIGFEAYAIGGLSVGEPVDVMYDIVAHTTPELPADRPRYLMGTGTPVDLVESVARGIDLFDCVLPTHLAWQGTAFTSTGRVRLRRGAYTTADVFPDSVPWLFVCGSFDTLRWAARHLD